MIIKRILYALMFALATMLVLSFVAKAQTTKTRAVLTTEINTNFADNNAGNITPTIARTTYLDMLASTPMINATAVGNTDYPMVAGDRYVYTMATLSAPRTWTLPPASDLNKGERIVVIDAFGGIGGANTLSVVRDGTDTINGGTAAVVLDTAYGSTQLITDGVSNWGVLAGGGGGGGIPGGSTTQVQYNNTGSFGGSPNLVWVSPALSIGSAGSATGQLKLAGTTSGTVTVKSQDAAGTFNFNLPIAAGSSGQPLVSGGGGATPMTWGSLAGSTTTFATTSGALVSGNCAKFDANGNIVDNGGACGGGSTPPGGSNTQVQYNNSAAFGGSANLTWVSPTLKIGVAGSATGQLQLTGSTSGTITVKGAAAAGTYNLNLPVTVGSSGDLLTSAGGGASAMTWTTPAILSKVDDTNVTLTLGGAPTTALLSAASITAGWTGTLAVARGGTGGGSASGTLLDNISGFSGTGFLTRTGGGTYAFQSATNGITLANNAQIATNTVLGNATAGTANIAAQAMPGCSSVGNALKWSTNVGFGCNTTLADLATADQTLSGGANVTAQSQSTGNITIDCGSRPLQYITNGGSFTLTAPANDGSCILLVTNNGSAGTITFSGFSVGANVGDALTTTNTNKFSIQIWRINGVSGYRIAAHQ